VVVCIRCLGLKRKSKYSEKIGVVEQDHALESSEAGDSDSMSELAGKWKHMRSSRD
jgi:hypothetical protein